MTLWSLFRLLKRVNFCGNFYPLFLLTKQSLLLKIEAFSYLTAMRLMISVKFQTDFTYIIQTIEQKSIFDKVEVSNSDCLGAARDSRTRTTPHQDQQKMKYRTEPDQDQINKFLKISDRFGSLNVVLVVASKLFDCLKVKQNKPTVFIWFTPSTINIR